MIAGFQRISGVEAAETGESDAQGREECARDRTVGVAQFTRAVLYRPRGGGVNVQEQLGSDLILLHAW
jgi:hypothetical protein